jgi:hypothetical protein
MKKSLSKGSLIATAVGMLFLSNTALAQSSPPAAAQQGKVKCLGANSCSGQSACKTATSPGKGKNSCAGKGFVFTASAKECTDKGGKPE